MVDAPSRSVNERYAVVIEAVVFSESMAIATMKTSSGSYDAGGARRRKTWRHSAHSALTLCSRPCKIRFDEAGHA